jgi:RNA polymerase sigma-70 factor (ECF subfamily)
MDELKFIEQLKSGNNNAFRQLINEYHQKVAATCYGFTGDYDAAQDLAQDVFVEVHRSIHRFRGESKISTWIYRISTNKSINWLRDNKKHLQSRSIQRFFSGENEKQLEIPQQSATDGLKSLFRQDDQHEIQQALNLLPDNQKTAFVLNKIDDLSYKEVAEIMEVPLSTIESLIFRARKNLQKHLKKYYCNR